ncbi:hypothetical protein [Thermogemmatispora sp.]|uniref:hypothetical protein n=1 Tax=Thermogemmatispora sp. TaxID=1968838 RepID=UPI002ACBE01D|nr:hypothetical protein [Thermogemmatispora sp.]
MTQAEAEALAEIIRSDLSIAVRCLGIEEESYAPGSYYIFCAYASGLPFVVRSQAMWQERRRLALQGHPITRAAPTAAAPCLTTEREPASSPHLAAILAQLPVHLSRSAEGEGTCNAEPSWPAPRF